MMKNLSENKAHRPHRMRYLWTCLLMLIAGTGVTLAGMLDSNVAKVGDTEYATIEEAVAAWGPGKTLTLLQNVTTTSTVTVEVNATKSTQNWTLNLGDHTWTADGCNAFQLYAAGGTVMNQNYGLKIYANQNGGITASGKYCIECKYDDSTAGYRPRLEIHGGTYNGSYIIYYYSSSWNNSNISNGPSTWFYKSNDGTEPVFNGNFGLFKCPIYLYAGYFNGTSFNTYPVNSTANTNLYGGHFKTISAFPSASNNKGIVYGNYKVFVNADASIDVINGAPATYEAKATKTLLLSSNQSVNYSDYVYYEKADDAIKKYKSGTIEIILSEGVTATESKSFGSGTLTIDTSAEGSDYTGNITLTGNYAKFTIKYPEGGGHYGVSVSSGQLHVEETIADGIVTRTYSRLATISDPETKVSDTGYSTVYDAFYAIDGTTDNKTIVLQKDVTNAGIVTNGTAVNAAGKTVATFDLNGHSIGIGSVACGNNADYTLTIIDSSEGKTGTVTNSDASLLILALTGINDYSGTYTLKIQAGTWQFDPSNVIVKGETHNLVDEGYYAHDNENGTWTVGEIPPVAKIGDVKYQTLAAAVAAANEGETIEVIKAGDYTLPNLPNNVTIEGKADGDVSFTYTTANSSIASVPNGATFKNVTFNWGNVNYHGFQHAGTINMEGCTLNGKFFSYGNMNFTNCEFKNDGDYNMWVYSAGNVVYDQCTFTNTTTGKLLHLYCEGANLQHTVTVKDCKFVNGGTLSKAAINVKATSGSNLLQYELHLEGENTLEGNFPTALGEQDNADKTFILSPLAQVDDRKASTDNITVFEGVKQIYPIIYVAQIGSVKYETLEEAFAAAQDGETITLLKDCTGNGIKVPQGKFTTGLTVDFAGFTYTMDGEMVGSTGTQTLAFQLLKDNTITFKNGTLTTENAYMLIQNYCNLTLEGMTLTMNNAGYSSAYTLSNNNGNIVIDGSTISANTGGGFAFDVCRYSSYPSVSVTVKGESVINGDVEVSASKSDVKDGFTLMLEGGSMTGNIVLDQTAKNAIESNPDKALVVKRNDFAKDAPADYKWVDNGDGTSTLAPKAYVAQIEDGAKYETLQAAVDAAEAGATINILTDFTLTTITTSPNNKYNVNINKSLTINGNGHVITSSTGKRALALTGEGNEITLKDLTIVNNKADWVMGILNNLTCTLDGTTIDGSDYKGSYNQPVTIGSIDAAGSVTLNVTNGSVIKTNDQGTAHYAVIAWHPANITVTDSKLIGWANIYLKPDAAGSTVKIEGSEMVSKGIKGSSNSFSVITAECGNNTIEVKDTKITTTPADNTYQSLFNLQGEGNVAKFLGTTTYETSNMTYGAVTFNWGSLMSNMVYFDETTKAAFEPYFDGTNNAVIADEKEVAVGLYPVNFVPEVLYYWATTEGYAGGYYKLTEPFGNGWLADGEFIALQKDIELTADIACSLGDGESFNFLLGEYSVTKGDFSIALNQGVSVFTDKQTDVFTAADAACTVVEEALTEGDYNFKYTVKTLEDAGIYLLIDGEPYERTTTVAATEVTYRRTFKDSQVGKSQAWFVPFDYTLSAEDAENFTFYKINFISASATPGVIEDNTAVFINIEALSAGKTLKGNRPYLVKPTKADTFDFVAENVNLLGIDESSRLKMSTSAFEYNFYGNYGTYSTSSDHELLAMNGGQICWNTAGAKLGSYRWLIKAISNFGDDDYSKLRFIIIGDEEDNLPTAIDDVNTVDDAIDAYYTVDGMKLESPTKGLNIVKYKSGRTKKVYIQ